jgi:hypothetical protein
LAAADALEISRQTGHKSYFNGSTLHEASDDLADERLAPRWTLKMESARTIGK